MNKLTPCLLSTTKHYGVPTALMHKAHFFAACKVVRHFEDAEVVLARPGCSGRTDETTTILAEAVLETKLRCWNGAQEDFRLRTVSTRVSEYAKPQQNLVVPKGRDEAPFILF